MTRERLLMVYKYSKFIPNTNPHPPLSYFAKLVSEGDKKDVFILIL